MKSLKQCKIISYHKRDKCAFSPQHDHPYVAEVYFFGKTREKVIVGTEIYGYLPFCHIYRMKIFFHQDEMILRGHSVQLWR